MSHYSTTPFPRPIRLHYDAVFHHLKGQWVDSTFGINLLWDCCARCWFPTTRTAGECGSCAGCVWNIQSCGLTLPPRLAKLHVTSQAEPSPATSCITLNILPFKQWTTSTRVPIEQVPMPWVPYITTGVGIVCTVSTIRSHSLIENKQAIDFFIHCLAIKRTNWKVKYEWGNRNITQGLLKDKTSTQKKWMRFSYQTLYSIILNDQIPCFHRKKKSEQTNPNSYSQSQHLWTYPKESLYMFTFYVDFTIKFGFREKD